METKAAKIPDRAEGLGMIATHALLCFNKTANNVSPVTSK
jgi:hypothetical protein